MWIINRLLLFINLLSLINMESKQIKINPNFFKVKNNKGEWIDAIAEKDEIVINVGDMLSRYTNNKLKSTIHRVVNPPKEYWSKSRYSIPFFLHPVGSMKLNVLDNCIDQNNPKKFEDITAHDFLINRLIDIGVMKKE